MYEDGAFQVEEGRQFSSDSRRQPLFVATNISDNMQAKPAHGSHELSAHIPRRMNLSFIVHDLNRHLPGQSCRSFASVTAPSTLPHTFPVVRLT